MFLPYFHVRFLNDFLERAILNPKEQLPLDRDVGSMAETAGQYLGSWRGGFPLSLCSLKAHYVRKDAKDSSPHLFSCVSHGSRHELPLGCTWAPMMNTVA